MAMSFSGSKLPCFFLEWKNLIVKTTPWAPPLLVQQWFHCRCLRFALLPKKRVVKQNGCNNQPWKHKKSLFAFRQGFQWLLSIGIDSEFTKVGQNLSLFWYTQPRFRISDTIWDTNTFTTGLRQHGMYLAYMTIWISCWPSNSTTIGGGCIQGDMHLYKCVSDWCWLISICLIEHQ